MTSGETAVSNAPAPTPDQIAPLEPTRVDSPVFSLNGLTLAIRQGEIISSLTQYDYQVEQGAALPIEHRFVIIASQDCDLDQDFRNRTAGDAIADGKLLRHVLVYEAHAVESAKSFLPKGRDLTRRIYSNKDERFAFFEAASADVDVLEIGIPELIIDFRRYFTIPTDELYRQINDKTADSAQRRMCLVSPYREHFQSRACQFQSRVGLPVDHESET